MNEIHNIDEEPNQQELHATEHFEVTEPTESQEISASKLDLAKALPALQATLSGNNNTEDLLSVMKVIIPKLL